MKDNKKKLQYRQTPLCSMEFSHSFFITEISQTLPTCTDLIYRTSTEYYPVMPTIKVDKADLTQNTIMDAFL